jgi:hypothetical protein
MRVKKKACRKIVPVLQEISCGNTVMILSRWEALLNSIEDNWVIDIAHN